MKGSKTEAQTTAVCFVPILMPRSSMSGQCLGILSIPFCTLQELKVTMERTEIVATGMTQNFINQTESEGYIVYIIQVRAVIRKITYFSSTSFSTHLETRLG